MANDADTELSVVVPAYSSASCIPELLRRLCEVLGTVGKNYEIVVVDDGSPDDTWSVLQREAPKYPCLKAVRLMRNFGQAKATICGMTHARGRIVVTMDDDLQHPPDQIPLLVDALERSPEVDCVFGNFEEKKHALYRNWGSRAIRWVNCRAFGLPKGLQSSSFRAMRGDVAKAITRHQTWNPAIAALLYGSTTHFATVTVRHDQRYAGRSNYSFSRQARLAFDNICNVSMLPLQVVSMMGLAACLVGFAVTVKVLTQYLTDGVGVPGWTTVVILISFFSGLNLLSLGIMGEYLARVLREVRGAPMYIERDRIGMTE